MSLTPARAWLAAALVSSAFLFASSASLEGDSAVFAAQKSGQSPGRSASSEGDSPIFASRKLGQSPSHLGQSPSHLGQSPSHLGQSPEGYTDYDAFRRELDRIARSPLVTLRSLGTTLGRREVFLLSIGTGKLDEKPAVLLVGSVEAPHLVGSELAVRIVRRLADEAAKDKEVRRMLERVTFYVIPRPAPDACEAFFQRPRHERSLNQRSIDDDGDGRIDEDGPEDLDGDGLITSMRVEDAEGPYLLHPDDDRLLIKADKKEHERGRYALYVEGRDRDHDEQLGEDPPGGVAFNRNFPFQYPYYERGAGPHQVSEVETRAVADFAFDHANIAAVLTATPEDNLVEPWKPDADASGRLKTALSAADAPYFQHVAEQYQEILGELAVKTAELPDGEGSFSEWAYFHFGRWSFAFRGWWIPEVAADAADEDEDDNNSDGEPSESAEKRGADERNALRWFAREGIDGFVPWKAIEHADFPGRKVELGGFRPFVLLNPPQEELEPLAEKHWQFVRRLTRLLPRLEIDQTEAEPLGGGVWRVKATVVNRGFLPTMPQTGDTTKAPQPVQVELALPAGVRLASGHARRQIEPLAGDGGRSDQSWLVTAAVKKPTSLRVRAWSPSVGSATGGVILEAGKR